MNDSSKPSSRRPRSSRGKVVAIAVVALGLIGYGTYTFFSSGNKGAEYIFATVQTGSIEDLVTATGTLQPRDYVDVGAQVSGQIQRIYVEVGDEVKQGDLLAEIDAETSKARVESNEASLASAKNNLENQRTNLEKARRDYERQKNLLAEDATTREQYLNAETSLRNAERSVVSSELTIKQQEANMRIERQNLAYTTITAPIDGTVMSIAVREGQTINASQSAPTVMRLANLNTMEVLADVSEADVTKVSPGMSVYFNTLGAGQNRRYFGQVKRREPTPKTQQGVVLYPVLFDVENDGSLMPNMTAQVFLVAAEARNVLTVPMAALQQGQQIAREMAAREGGGQGAGGMPNMMARTEGAPAGAAGGSAPATASDAPAGNAGGPGAPGAGGAGPGAGGRPQGGPPGGMPGGFNGGQSLTPEQIEEFRRMRGAGAGGAGGFGGFAGRGGGAGMAAGGGRQPQQRRGTVMVKLADGTLEPRQVVIGVTDRVLGQVIEGLEEGEEVVIGRREPEAEAAPAAATTQPQNNNFRGQGGFSGGGGFRPF